MYRRKAREKALQILFQFDIQQGDINEIIEDRFENDQIDENQREFITNLIAGAHENLVEIDQALEDVIEGWNLQRIGKVEKNILRLAVYELLFTDLSENIVINEAVELAKTFSTNQSAGFINGILAKYIKISAKPGGGAEH